MQTRTPGWLLSAMLIVAASGPANATGWFGDRSFNRIATFANYVNASDISVETVSEIVAVTGDGNTLIYTDAETNSIGFVDISDPYFPEAAGTVALTGEPTSVSVAGRYALVGVNTSPSLTSPSGLLAVIDLGTGNIVREIDLGGQPDSVAVSPDGRFAAVAIENERDEDIIINGVEGGLPQLPAGFLAIVDLVGPVSHWTVRQADLTGLGVDAPSDPEAEFVDINFRNQAVVSLQENNGIAVVDLYTGHVIADFDAGAVDLEGIDTTEDELISLTDSLAGVVREPDAVAWVPRLFFPLIATANEGDLFGGSRGFTLFTSGGHVVYDSGNQLERLGVRHGHYDDGRSGNKGTEPEAIEYGRYGFSEFLFVAGERAGYVAVYQMFGNRPIFKQFLPAPLRPEGVLAVPHRNLLIVSGESDDPSFGVRSSIQIYKLERGQPDYPQILSANDDAGNPIGWSALSGMTAVPGTRNTLLAVSDSAFARGQIFTINASRHPAVITDELVVDDPTGTLNLDLEGIAVAPDHTLWLASEGQRPNEAGDERRNRILQIDGHGNVLQVIGLPAEIEACRAASTETGTLGSGFEGLAILPSSGGYKILVAQQRGWNYTTAECEHLDDDDGGLNANGQPNRTRIWIYDPAHDSWDFRAWELAPLPENASWTGLSEITDDGKGGYVIIERDNRTGDFTGLKTLVRVHPGDASDGIITPDEKSVFDLIPALEATNGWISDKPEGVAITSRGRVFLVTDNDFLDDWSGETSFLRLGRVNRLFR